MSESEAKTQGPRSLPQKVYYIVRVRRLLRYCQHISVFRNTYDSTIKINDYRVDFNCQYFF